MSALALAADPAEDAATAIYARLSLDRNDDAQAVARQLEDCREWCAERRVSVLADLEFTDNDISASRFSKKPRPGYAALLDAVQAGLVRRILCFNIDRLYRRPMELETLIALADRGHLEIVGVVGQSFDLTTPYGR